ncbi:MAG: glutathione peroxidase [Gammaproteobacteria bacterium]|nr:glutathione peroxidase [Gammaproteobacteria bacterium]
MGFHQYKMKGIDGTDVAFDQYQGKHCLVVNVASECGMTPQYEGLQRLQSNNAEKGFTVLGFPCNQFGEQEPGTDAEICDFAQSRYNATFPMFSKVEVRGDNACALYQWLTSQKARPDGKPNVAWNFTKFLIDPDGNVVERFEPRVTPEEIGSRLRELL